MQTSEWESAARFFRLPPNPVCVLFSTGLLTGFIRHGKRDGEQLVNSVKDFEVKTKNGAVLFINKTRVRSIDMPFANYQEQSQMGIQTNV